MKIKKILSLAITLMMVLSVASIPAMAAELPSDAYTNISSDDFVIKELTDVVNNTRVDIDEYTLDEFKADFAAAKYTAFEDFEGETVNCDRVVAYGDNGDRISDAYGTTATGQIALYTFTPEVKGVANGTFPIRIYNPSGNTTLYMKDDGGQGKFSSGTRALYSNDNTTGSIDLEFEFPNVSDGGGTYNAIKINNVVQDKYKVTAFGAVVHQVFKSAMDFYITLDDSTEVKLKVGSKDITKVNRFLGYKAPTGKYITKVTIGGSATRLAIDDLGIIFENVEETDAPQITLTTDEAAENKISALADVTGSDVYVNIPEGDFSGKKVLLALYGGAELLDVAVANEGMAQAHAQVPADKTLTSIKAFVWDFAKGLVPAQGPIEINQ